MRSDVHAAKILGKATCTRRESLDDFASRQSKGDAKRLKCTVYQIINANFGLLYLTLLDYSKTITVNVSLTFTLT